MVGSWFNPLMPGASQRDLRAMLPLVPISKGVSDSESWGRKREAELLWLSQVSRCFFPDRLMATNGSIIYEAVNGNLEGQGLALLQPNKWAAVRPV